MPSFRFLVPGNICMYPCSGVWCRRTSECTLVLVFGTREHPPKPPFGNHPSRTPIGTNRNWNACRLPENAQRGGQEKRGPKPHEETPHGKPFPTPVTSVRFAPPSPPNPISLSKSLVNSQNLPQLTTSETAFGGSRKMVSDEPREVLLFGTFCPPPHPLALPRIGSFFAYPRVHTLSSMQGTS